MVAVSKIALLQLYMCVCVCYRAIEHKLVEHKCMCVCVRATEHIPCVPGLSSFQSD